MSRRRIIESLPFRLIDMTEAELYDEVNEIYESANLEYLEIPPEGSDNDSVAESEPEDLNIGINEPDILLSEISEESDTETEWEQEDLIPLSQLQKLYKIEWTKDNINTPPETFQNNSGLQQIVQNLPEKTPYKLFKLLITDEIIDEIVFQTNLYAEQNFQKINKAYQPTDKEEIKTFIGINLLMGIKKLPSYRDYWSTKPSLHDSYISRLSTVHRFGWHLSNIHLNDNNLMPNRGSPNFDKLYKVRPFLEQLKKNFKACLCPHENLAVDESMIKFKGRSTIKEYMPAKPVKRGYKVWMLADQTGYCLDFDIYVGKTGNPTEGKNLGYRVVMQLTAGLENRYHRVFF